MSAEVTIYSDGGAEPNPGVGGWGAVLLVGGTVKKQMKGGAEDTTNNRMELTGAISGIEAAPQDAKIHVITDSTYVKNGITKWVDGWMQRGWRLKSGDPVQNSDLWQQLVALTSTREVTWAWTKGHAGNRYNEMADQLATAGRKELQRGGGSAESPAAPPAPRPKTDVRLIIGIAHTKGKGGAWAARLESGEHHKMLTGKGPSKAPNRLYLEAFLAGLEALKRPTSIELVTGLDYLRSGATMWIKGWKARAWKQKTGSPVAHSDVWQAIDAKLADHQLFAPKPEDPADLELIETMKKAAKEHLLGKPKPAAE